MQTDKCLINREEFLLLPPLRDHAMLDKDVVVIGSANRAEIWDRETWEKFNSDITLEDINAALADLVL